MDTLLPQGLDNLSSLAVALIVVWAIARGTLVTRREADGLRKDRDEWRSAHTASELARQASERQVTELLEHARVADALVRGLSEVANRETP